MAKRLIIGFAGRKRSGKSTAAEHLEKLGFIRMSFADPIREMVKFLLVAVGLEFSVEWLMNAGKETSVHPLGRSTRYLMQTLGTEWGRELVNPRMWVLIAKARIEDLDSAVSVVFDDVRFEDEAAMIRELGGIVVHIDRPLGEVDYHVSEAGICEHESDYFLDNDLDVEDYLLEVDALLAGLM
jgi:hypothetical protein